MISPLQQIVHDLRQPLTITEACVWQLRNLLPPNPQVEECLACIERQVFEVSRILTEAGSYTPEPPEATNSANAPLT